MQRFALSLALMLAFGFAGTAKAADEATDTGAPKQTAPATTKHKSCYKKSRACHKGKKKAETTTESTGTSTDTTK